MFTLRQGKITRLDSSEIRESGRSAQGVRVIRLEEGDRLAAACLVKSETNGGLAQAAKPGGEPDYRGLVRGFVRAPRETARAARNARRALKSLEAVA